MTFAFRSRVTCAAAVLGVGLGAMPGGCAGTDKPTHLVGHLDENDPRWPYWPRELRIHPLTRLVVDAEQKPLYIEARIEFLDPEGHTSKACGELRLEIHDAGVRQSVEPLVWERMDLGDLEFNHRYFDEITRTYVFRLELAEGQALPARPLLTAYYLGARGETFEPRRFEVRTQ